MAVLLAEAIDDHMLRQVRVLILVHEHEPEVPLITIQHLGVVAKEDVRLEQQLVEIHRLGLPATVLIAGVDLADEGHMGAGVVLHLLPIATVGLGRDEGVLGVRDAALHKARAIRLLVQLHFAENAADQVARVGGVVDGEVRVVVHILRLFAQDAIEDGVERAGPKLAHGTFVRQGGDAVLHLACSLVRKGQGQDAVRLVATAE